MLLSLLIMADEYYGFHGISQIGDFQTTEQIENNLVNWLNWGNLCIGSFNTVDTITDSGATRLRQLNDPRYPSGTIWQGVRSDWIWETGINYAIQPTRITGIYFNGNFISSGTTGNLAHKINFQDGQVIFQSGIPSSSIIQVNHSYRYTQTRRSDEPFFQNLIFNSFNQDDPQFTGMPLNSGAGYWNILPENRVELPCYVVQPLTDVKLKPYEIGQSINKEYKQNFIIHVLAETAWERKRLHDILIKQYGQTIKTIDFNNCPMPLDFDKTLTSGAMTYPQAYSGYPWNPIRIVEVSSNENEDLGKKIHWSTVRYVLQGYIS